jgi:hypothetical protein
MEAKMDEICPDLVIIDPLSAFLGGTDSYKDSEVRVVLAPLVQLAERHRSAILAVLHLRKASADRHIHRVGGSIALGAAARSVLLAGVDPDRPDSYALVQIKSNLACSSCPEGYRIVSRILSNGVESSAVEWTGATDLTAERIMGRAECQEPGALAKAETFLREELSAGPVHSMIVYGDAAAQGITERTLERAKARLRVKSTRDGFGKGAKVFWALPGSEGLDLSGIHRHGPLATYGKPDMANYGEVMAGQGLTEAVNSEDRQVRGLAIHDGTDETDPLWEEGGRDTLDDESDAGHHAG